MKPGGPTEAKIGETMANQGVTNTDLLAAAKQKPKVSKIDPLTGLPEVKTPKLKKPTTKMWEQVAQQQKPKTNPWFQSSKIKPVENEAHSANTRTMDGLLQYSKNGSLPALYADSLKNGDEKAVHEYANFMQQLSDRKGDRVDGFHQEVISRLPENVKKVFEQLEMDVGGSETPMGANAEPQFSEWIEAHSTENVQRGKDASETGDENTKDEKGENEGDVTVAGGDGDDGKCDQKQAEYKARKEEYDSYENAITTLDGAIEDLENDIKDYKGKDPSFFDYECRKKVREFIKLVELYDIFFGKGKAVSKLLKLKLEWLTVMACSDSKAAERKRQFIEDMESALDGLISIRDDIEDALPDKETEVNDALDALGDCQDNA